MCDLVDRCQIWEESCCMFTVLALVPEKEVISFLRRIGNYPAHYLRHIPLDSSHGIYEISYFLHKPSFYHWGIHCYNSGAR